MYLNPSDVKLMHFSYVLVLIGGLESIFADNGHELYTTYLALCRIELRNSDNP